jgi:hypothetical protein
MKKQVLHSALLLCVSAIVFTACKKEINPDTESQQVQGAGNNGHEDTKMAKQYDAEGVTKWMALQLYVIRTTPAAPTLPSGINNSRYFAYCGIALYESILDGMPSSRSLVGQLQDMPAIPQPVHSKPYHWPTVANAALAFMNKNMLSWISVAGKVSLDSLENALNNEYRAVTGDEIFNRSSAYGRAVAQVIYNWSLTDGSQTIHPVYTPPSNPGNWQPTPPGFGAAATPFWGTNRLLVVGSLDQSQPAPFPAYSTNPLSPYYALEREVYDVSQHLTPQQIEQALYYRDNPGWPAGLHYLSILMQAIQKDHTALDKAARAYAQTGIAIGDCVIACWQSKYFYNVQRPISYIRSELGFTTWNSLFPTPPHPDYPSGHSTTAGAAEVMLTDIYGSNFSLDNHTYDFLGMPFQHYSNFSDMAAQIGEARVLAGIHTSLACTEARKQGQKIARNILNRVVFQNGGGNAFH